MRQAGVEPLAQVALVLEVGEARLQARVHRMAAGGDAKEVPAEQMVARAHLVNLDLARAAHPVGIAVQFDQPVHQRVLGMRLVARQRREQQRGAAHRGHQRVQLVDEFRQRQLGFAELARAAKAVHDQQARPVVGQARGDQPEEAVEAVLDQLVIARHEHHLLRDGGRIEEVELAQVAEQFVVRLGDQRHVEHALALAHAMKADLAGQDGLARAGHPLDQIKAAAHEAAAEDLVEARHARRHVFQWLDVGECRSLIGWRGIGVGWRRAKSRVV